ncbi:MmpS family transport accessory protein [Mycobacterium sp. NPDC003323]
MTEYPRRDEPTRRLDGGNSGYSGYVDPAYAGQSPYRPTEQMPAYPAYGYDPYTGQYGGPPPPPPGAPEPPEPPRTPRWLWIVAGIAVLTVIGLVIALVIVNSSQQETVVAPVPSLGEPTDEPTVPTTTRRPTTTTTPRTAVPPATTPSTTPSTTAPSTTPGATETVTYTVDGQGRAINITYVDNGGVLQTEFNVLLPWSKEVALPQPAKQSASVSIINVGREVTCSISIEGAEVQERSGSGLTICSPLP